MRKTIYNLNYIIALIFAVLDVSKVQASSYYWVGGAGKWSDYQTHWATTSGGGTFQTSLPKTTDNVFFDANSFTANGQKVTIDIEASCNNMDWTGTDYSPVLEGISFFPLNLYGSLKMPVVSMTINFTGALNFFGNTTGNTIKSNNKVWNSDITFQSGVGEWILEDSLTTTGSINLYGGNLISDNQHINCRNFNMDFNAALSMISSTYRISGFLYVDPSATIALSAANSIILMTGVSGTISSFNGGGLVYYDVNFTSTSKPGEINGNSHFNNVNLNGDGSFSGNNAFTNITLSPARNYTFQNGSQQTITGSITANGGNCRSFIVLNSDVSGSPATIKKTSGSIDVSYVSLQDMNATGGATFTASNSIDVGDNSGWTITSSSQTLYWVGGSGNWSDVNHWSLTSGGSNLAGCPILQTDDVIFDVNSFNASGQRVTIDVSNASCRNMTWTSVTNNPDLFSNNQLAIYGSLTLEIGMTLDFHGNIIFHSATIGNTITSAGKTFLQSVNNGIFFNGIGGEWILQDDLTTNGDIVITNGTLNTNNEKVSSKDFRGANGSLNLGSSVFNIHDNWMADSTLKLSAGTSEINLIDTPCIFTGGGHVYYNLSFIDSIGTEVINSSNNSFNDVTFYGRGTINGTNNIFDNVTFVSTTRPGNINGNSLVFNSAVFNGDGNINGNNNFTNLTLSPGHVYVLKSGAVQTVTNLNDDGNCSRYVTIHSDSVRSAANIKKVTGSLQVNYNNIQDITATGGAIFTANNSFDSGNNPGWNFTFPNTPRNLYWIGDGGNWSDGNHWSLTSGGASPAGCPPLPLDNVFFDLNSFTSGGQTVTIDVSIARCKSITWTGVTHNPTFFSSGNALEIFGSMTLTSGMNLDFTGPLSFLSTTNGNTLTSAGKTFNQSAGNAITFNGLGGEWTMQDDLTTTGNIILTDGALNSNNNTVNGNSFNGNGGTLNMGFSIFNFQSSWIVSSTLNLNAGTSDINISGTRVSETIFNGGGHIYYNLNFTDLLALENITGSTHNTFHDVTFNGPGFINDTADIFHDVVFVSTGQLGNINGDSLIFNSVTFNADGNVNGNNTFTSLSFSVGRTYTLQSGVTQTISNLTADGTCSLYTSLHSTTAGSTAFVKKLTGTLMINYNNLQDISALGGATFTADNSLNMGDNPGWNFTSSNGSRNLYWVGNGGNWSDESHWSLTSGGNGIAGCQPQPTDNVFFDVNSFTSTGQTIILDVAIARCNNMTWTGITHNPTFSSTGNALSIFGSLTLAKGMNLDFNGPLNFQSTTIGNTITSAGNIFFKSSANALGDEITFNGDGGAWTLQDSLMAFNGNIILLKGTVNTNNKTVNGTNFSGNGGTLNMGSSVFNIKQNWTANLNLNLNSGTSTINIVGESGYNAIFNGGGLVYNNLNFTDSTLRAEVDSDKNTFNDVDFYGQGFIKGGKNIFHDVIFKGAGSIDGEKNMFNDVSFVSPLTGPEVINSDSNAFHDIIFYGRGEIKGAGNNFHDVSFVSSSLGYGSINSDNSTFHDVIFSGQATIDGNANTFHDVTFHAAGYTTNINGNLHTFHNINFIGDADINSSNFYSNISFSPGHTYTFSASSSQLLIDTLNAAGTDVLPITIQSDDALNYFEIVKTSGTVCADYLRLSNCAAFGGATFYAGPNSVDLGGNSGWIFPGPLSATSGTDTAETQFVAHWNAFPGASSYLIDISTDSTFTNFITAGGITYDSYNVGNVTSITVTGLKPGTIYYYRIRVINYCGVSTNSNLIITSTSGTPSGITSIESNNKSVNVYPNPVQDRFYVSIVRKELGTEAIKIELLNQLGQVLQTTSTYINEGMFNEEFKVPIGLANGFYFLRTTVQSNVYVNKLAINPK